ncbi:uncharacterized protein THITE_115530 [Thermothielavioides terrestris NRRL 8126]|uniref:Uncharacterized protein n=1 Tax=Thermothielavioides terrestris (strain ATCC 38088 / NRRL 8126) TaxID=578455 RepID=G2QVT7_THETT|nr:uncharacterized protein THITE_115530 [Thermothielavioides terrestris NRRL 8126]AEO63868.1 hypothetical protein THITE_115530 [Thermothielavioides terrestris NRRL 8126]
MCKWTNFKCSSCQALRKIRLDTTGCSEGEPCPKTAENTETQYLPEDPNCKVCKEADKYIDYTGGSGNTGEKSQTTGAKSQTTGAKSRTTGAKSRTTRAKSQTTSNKHDTAHGTPAQDVEAPSGFKDGHGNCMSGIRRGP